MSEYDLDSGPDPADRAAAAPEQRHENAVPAVGIGPGNLAYLTPRGRRAIAEADVVVGFESVVEFVADVIEGEALTCGYRDEAETLSAFGDRVAAGEDGTAVAMGDPNHSGYQFVGKVEAAVERPVEVIPGISSLQIAASRARTPMEDSRFVTLHKSGDISADLDRIRAVAGDRHLLVLPRPYDWMPEDIAADLLDSGVAGGLDALVLEHLTHDEETITRTALADLAEQTTETEQESPFSDLSVFVLRAD
ncbi:cobalt-precorrin-7 (C(5))-methyltransferase [Halovenus sp. WSH3]|uniref:Cobalt-precorrin-7 (C(5))-methyltransferase n=1 Tax=Halovenus carboxidivorans TaxID=2692199 RepID=A0A6B0SWV2_9EURY|nr:cobalt-precorrin-7 (C(5))-methyltransferase [Halovenus carboxidivorans]MXR50024.1 cobalt-precorrin-7 (C(5))-methyltransferase [Halovenus carboxidivorans]